MLATKAISQAFSTTSEWVPFSYSHTYAGNPVAIHVVAAALDELSEAHRSGHLETLAQALKAHASKLASHPRVVRINSAGLVFGMTLSPELGEHSGKRMEQLCHDQQVVIRGEEDWICVVPAYITTVQELDKVFEVIHASIDAL